MSAEDDVSPGSTEAMRARRQEAVARLGLRALASPDLDVLIEEALDVVCATLDADLCGLLEAQQDPGRFAFRAGRGWRPGVVGALVPVEPGSALRYMLDSHLPVVYEDLRSEDRFVPPRLLLEHGVVAGIGVTLPGRDRPVGVLGAHARTRQAFTADDASFLQAIANVLASAIERSRADEEIRRREERFRALADNAQDIVYRFRVVPDLAFEYINPAVFRILGRTPEQYYADPMLIREVVVGDDRRLWRDAGTTFAVSQPVVVRCIRPDGAVIWLEIRHVPIVDQQGTTIALEGIARDVTASKRAEQELRRAYEHEREIADRLRALDEMKNGFLHAVSHELRTPLTNILGIALTLGKSMQQLTSDERIEVVGRLTSNARKLDRLLGDLLDIDRLRRGVVEPVRTPTPVLGLVRRVAEELDIGSRALGIEGDEVVAMVDGPKVERIVENLLVNAARHTPADARIWVRVEPAGAGGVLLTVEDDGAGIPEDLRAAVFEPFRQGAAVDPAAPGTGIGLSLVALFAEMHSGRAWVEEGDKGGARFRVMLPGSTG